ncbi:MAG: hypothetical protein Q8L55_14105 [Phycisphaerales bacterium]|nr:hypothetical protein [Phycisphaerales bacterium]
MSVLEVKWVRLPCLPLPVVHPPRSLSVALHRLQVRWRWLVRSVRNAPPPPPVERGEQMLARV